MAPFQLAMRTPLRRALGGADLPPAGGAKRGEPPQHSFTVVCEARQGLAAAAGNGDRRATCTGSPPGRPSRERFAARRRATTARAPWPPRRRSTRATSWARSATSASSTKSNERLPGVRRAAVRVAAGRVAARTAARTTRSCSSAASAAGWGWRPTWRPPDSASALLGSARQISDGRLELRVANRASVQASLGGRHWAALEPERRLYPTPSRCRRWPRPPASRSRSCASRAGVGGRAWMWQTILNAFTFHENFAREGSRRHPSSRRRPRPPRVRDRRRGDGARGAARRPRLGAAGADRRAGRQGRRAGGGGQAERDASQPRSVGG